MLAEYDGYGQCLREYIYIGAKMMAEYQPTTGKYYYYTTDQINSTRVVTDDTAEVVYSAAHDPYAGVQQTKKDIQQNLDDSVNSEPRINVLNSDIELSVNCRSDLSNIKFSGKEQGIESGLYYFGARYYDPTLYRFLSPDPVIPTERALYNPQRWNLYGYCLGNPLIFIDINGLSAGYITKLNITRTNSGPSGTTGSFVYEGLITVSGVTLELPWRDNKRFISCIPPGDYEGLLIYQEEKNRFVFLLQGPNIEGKRDGILIQGGRGLNSYTGMHICREHV